MNNKLKGKNYILERMLQKCAPSADGGTERITEGLKMGQSEKIPKGPAGLGLQGLEWLGVAMKKMEMQLFPHCS